MKNEKIIANSINSNKKKEYSPNPRFKNILEFWNSKKKPFPIINS